MKLSNKELYNYARTKHDDSNNDFWKPKEFILNYQEARLEWLKIRAAEFERNEEARRDLEPFVAEPHNFGSTNKVALGALIFPYEKITMVHGEWKFECNGELTARTLPIPPKPIEKAILSLNDYAEQPDDTEPFYIEEKEGGLMFLRILSLTVPSNLTVHYIKQPKPLDLIDNPNGFTDEGYSQQLQILDIALKKKEITAENYPKAQAVLGEIQTGI